VKRKRARFARSGADVPMNEELAAQARELFGLERIATLAEVEAFLVERYGARSLPLDTLPIESYVNDEDVEYPLVTSLWSIEDPAVLQTIASDVDRQVFYPYEDDPDDFEYPPEVQELAELHEAVGEGRRVVVIVERSATNPGDFGDFKVMGAGSLLREHLWAATGVVPRYGGCPPVTDLYAQAVPSTPGRVIVLGGWFRDVGIHPQRKGWRRR
jgi:hypothetical protein